MNKQSLQLEQNYDLIMIRHAQSQFNSTVLDYTKKHNLIFDWEHICKDQRFLATVKYHPSLIDCHITEKGLEQCQIARQAISFQPDLILVSPLNRALETCMNIFPAAKCQIIAQPLLAEALRSSCDYSQKVEQKKLKYCNVDFEKIEELGQFWYIDRQSKEDQEQYHKVLRNYENFTYQQKMEALLAYSLKTNIYETASHLRVVGDKLKQLFKEYKKKYNKIAVVCHYNIIRFILATKFNEKDEPFHSHIENCQIIRYNVENDKSNYEST